MHKQHSKCVAALVGVATMAWAAASAQAQPLSLPEFKPSSDRGFSYFLGLAQQTAIYSEKPSIVNVRTSSKTKSAMLVSGALYAFNDDLLLSLDNLSTFAPANSKEQWHATSATLPVQDPDSLQWVETPVNGTLLQTNRFSLSQSNTRALAYFRQRQNTFLVGGVNFRSQSFKRYDFRVRQPNIIREQPTPMEESTSELVAEVGVAWEGERVKMTSSHYGLRFTLGTPVWRQVTNTGFPGQTFDSRKGWDANVEGRYSWALNDVVHLGLWGKYSFSERSNQIFPDLDDPSILNEMPTSSLRTTTVGIELLWKL
jgi:hypothetical protein